MNLSLEAAQVNPKCFVFGHERMHVDGRFNSSAANGSANGFSMVHQAVEIGGAEPPVAEGAPVNASSKVAIVMAGLQPPEDMMSLGVEGLIIAVDIAALHLSRSTKDHAKNMESIATMMEQRVNKRSCMIICARKKEVASVILDTLISRI
jgi:hypothetical protein